MAEIARRSGLQQSSLYYYFRNKEQVLDEIVAEANRAPLALSPGSAPRGARPRCSSTGSIRTDVVALCALPYDINEVHRLAARDRDGSTATGGARAADREVAAVGGEGVGRGELAPSTPASRAHRAGQRRGDPELDPPRARGGPVQDGGAGPPEVGAFLADLIVGGLLADPRRLDASGARPTDSRRARSLGLTASYRRPVTPAPEAGRVSTAFGRHVAVSDGPSTETDVSSVRVSMRSTTTSRPRFVGLRRARGAAVVATAASAARPRHAGAAATITLGYSAWPGWFPLAVAEEAGIFEDVGLDVKLATSPTTSRRSTR